jgi:hypothetical protein
MKGDGQSAQPGQTAPPAQRTINAWAIRVVTDGTRLIMGRVESINGNNIVLHTPAKRDGVAVTFDSTTGYKAAQPSDRQMTLTNATQADVKVGSVLTIEGVPSADGKSLAAKAVIIMPQKPANR